MRTAAFRVFRAAAAAARQPASRRLFAASSLALSAAAVAPVRANPSAVTSAAPAPAAAAAAAGTTTASVHTPVPSVLFVLGGPGAGKGTQCARLVSEYGYVHLSAGDLLREERKSGSKDGDMIEEYIRDGRIVPVEVTVKLLKKAMQESGASKFLIDGFPRNFDNLEGWLRVIGDSAVVKGVLSFDCPEDEMEKRLLERGKTSGRSDDNIESIRKRFKTHVESTLPVVQYYAKQGKVMSINANQSVEAVTADVVRALAPLLKEEVVDANQRLLDAIHTGDWATYNSMSDADLTAIEPESKGEILRGMGFHLKMFEDATHRPDPHAKSTLENVEVRMLSPKAAVVSSRRIIVRPERTEKFGETRVWQFVAGQWKQVHFHRSPIDARCCKSVTA